MSLRKPTPSDASCIAALSIEVWIGTYLKRGISPFFAEFALATFTTEKMEALIRDPRQAMFVSENDEGIDGVVRVSFDSDAPVAGCSSVEISTLYVQPRHHGKGIGRRLLTAALQCCHARGADAVWLATNAENDPAIAFYHAQGFQHVGETYFCIDDQQYLNNVYAYRFDGPITSPRIS